MNKMQFHIENRITLSGAPQDLLQELLEYFTIDNPAYAQAKKMGRFTGGMDPRLCFAEITAEDSIVLPRGAARFVYASALRHGGVEILDRRLELPEIDLCFHGILRAYQEQAVQEMLTKDFGILEAGTGAGKTVMGLAIIAARRQPTLVLVHTKELLHQWRDRIRQFLGIDVNQL